MRWLGCGRKGAPRGLHTTSRLQGNAPPGKKTAYAAVANHRGGVPLVRRGNLDDSLAPPNDEEGSVSKTVYVVGGIGAMGCVMLSLMMQHLLKVRTESKRSPVAIEIEQAFPGNLVGPVDVTTPMIDGERTMLVRLAVGPGIDGAPFGRSVADVVWRRAYQWPEMPDRIMVEVRTERQPRDPVVVVSRAPGLDRRLRAAKAAGAAAGGVAEPSQPAAPRTPEPPK